MSPQGLPREALNSRKHTGATDEIKQTEGKRRQSDQIGEHDPTGVIPGQGSDHAAAQQSQEQSEGQGEIVKGETKLWLPKTIEEELATIAAEKPKFKEIISQLNLNNITHMASRLRQLLEYHQQGRQVQWVRCRVNPKAVHGSYNLVFRIEFEDNIQWCLKIPANGQRRCFDNMAAAALAVEALTMQKIKLETTIPLPTMHFHDRRVHNEIGCPFILMEWLQGKPLWDVWFDERATPARLEQVRLRALQTIATAMVQLNRYQANCSGAWLFDSGIKAYGVSGNNVIDMWDMPRDANQEEMNDRFVEKPSSADPMDTLLFMLNRRGLNPQSSPLRRGVDMALKLFTKWGEERASSEGPQFVLAHPDLDIQNILVDEDGTLCGILDWDGVAFVPHSVGCLKYPMFLTRDWCPELYNYDTRDGGKKWPNSPLENSPNELRRYRAMYAHFVEAAFSTNLSNEKTPRAYGDVTRRSALMASLAMADHNPRIIGSIVENIFLGIKRFTADVNFDTWLAKYRADGIVSISVNGKDRLATEMETVKSEDGNARIKERCDARGTKRSRQEVDSGEETGDNQTGDDNADGTSKTGASHHNPVEGISIDVQGKRCIAKEARLSLDPKIAAVKVPEYSGRPTKKARRHSAEAVHKISIPGFKAEITQVPKEGLPGEAMVQTTEDAAPSHSQTSVAAKDPGGSSPPNRVGITDRIIEERPNVAKEAVNTETGASQGDKGAEVAEADAVPLESTTTAAKKVISLTTVAAAAEGLMSTIANSKDEPRHGEDVPDHRPIDKRILEMDDIFVALGTDTLDQAGYSRLRCGFEFFVDHLLGRF